MDSFNAAISVFAQAFMWAFGAALGLWAGTKIAALAFGPMKVSIGPPEDAQRVELVSQNIVTDRNGYSFVERVYRAPHKTPGGLS